MARKLALLIALFALASPAASGAAKLPPGFIGLSPQSAAKASDFKLMREAGVTNVRLPMFWFGVNGKSPYFAGPNWIHFDREVEIAAREGIRIMPFVWGSPEWVTDEVIDLPVETPWQRWAWTSFLRAAAERYGSTGSFWKEHPELPFLPVEQWEIWNEQNLVTFATDPDPAKFATLIRLAGRTLHRADPEAKVIIGGFFGRPLQVPPNIATGDFLARIYRAGNVKRWFDGVGLHPYVAEAGAMRAQLRNMRRIMRANGDAATPIYVTEMGWGSRSGPTRWERGPRGQAKQLSNAFAMLAANRKRWNIGGVWWFTWSDEGGGCLFCKSAGLLTAAREAKPSWYRFNAWTGGNPRAVPRAGVEDLEAG